jgi:hypothetical protein
MAFLNNNIISSKEFREDIYEYKKEFTIDYEENLFYTTLNDLFYYTF